MGTRRAEIENVQQRDNGFSVNAVGWMHFKNIINNSAWMEEESLTRAEWIISLFLNPISRFDKTQYYSLFIELNVRMQAKECRRITSAL